MASHANLPPVDSTLLTALCEMTSNPTATFKSYTQARAMAVLRQNERHLLFVAPTGHGKSLVYLLPAYIERSTALVTVVVVPFLKLKQQAVKNAIDLLIPTTQWKSARPNEFSTITFMSIEHATQDSGLDALRLLEAQGKLSRLVYDEAHISLIDARWRPVVGQVRALGQFRCPLVLMTATCPTGFDESIPRALGLPETLVLRVPFNLDHVQYTIDRKPSRQSAHTYAASLALDWISFLKNEERGIVWVRDIFSTKVVAEAIGVRGFHFNGQEHEESARQYDAFSKTAGGVMVATSALSTGLDVSHIRFSISVGVPDSMALLLQEMGRAGRDSGPTRALIIDYPRNPSSDPTTPVQQGSDFAGKVALDALVASPQACIRAALTSWTDANGTPCAASASQAATCSRCVEVEGRRPLAVRWPDPRLQSEDSGSQLLVCRRNGRK
jgi:superfamily II DNA helicase RecQ